MANFTGTNGDDFMNYSGFMTHLTMTLVNPYDGSTEIIDEDYFMNDSYYDGMAGIDTLFLTNNGDALFIRDGAGVQTMINIERIQAGSGGDVIILADPTIILNDVNVDGGSQDDIIWGNVGADTINGRAGNDRINGGPGNDFLYGQNDHDHLTGGAGNDTLDGGSGLDVLFGGTGNDTLIFAADAAATSAMQIADAGSPGVGPSAPFTLALTGKLLSHDTFYGGDGYDVLQGTANADVIQLYSDTLPHHAEGENRRLHDIEEIRTGAGHDVVNLTHQTESYGDVRVLGEDGDDTILTSSGNDVLDGGNGADYLSGGVGHDRLFGGAGNDILRGGPNGGVSGVMQSVTYDKDFSGDTVFPPLVETQSLSDITTLGIPQADLNVDYATTLTMTFVESVAGHNNMIGAYTVGDDGTFTSVHMAFRNGHATTAGTQYSFDVDGAYGFFLIDNGFNLNGFQQGGGFNFSNGTLEFIYKRGTGEERAATINDDGSFISLVYSNGSAQHVLQGSIYHSTVRGTSDFDINHDNQIHTVSGLASPDDHGTLRIGFEDLPHLGDADYNDGVFDISIASRTDQIVLVNDDDYLDGGTGNDTLYGGVGNDTLIGGAGADILYGEDGADIFAFTVLDGFTDLVADFNVGQGDTLNITDLLTGFDALTDAIADFVCITTQGGDAMLSVNADGDIGGAFTDVAVIAGAAGLTLENLVADGALVTDHSAVV